MSAAHPHDDRRLTTADLAEAARRERDGQREHDRERFDRARDERTFEARDDRRDDPGEVPLFDEHELGDLRARWDTIQTSFVDDPRHTVEEADALVAATIERLTESFAHGRARLEQQWSRGDQVSTEELRLALTRYRSFFHRLLAM